MQWLGFTVLLLAMTQRRCRRWKKKRITRSIKAYRHFPCMYLTLMGELKCAAVYALSRRLARKMIKGGDLFTLQ
jgi:hypothetical protein